MGGRTVNVCTDAMSGCVEACRFVDVSLPLVSRVTVSGQKSHDDDHISTDVNAHRQYVRKPVDVRIVRRQNTAVRNTIVLYACQPPAVEWRLILYSVASVCVCLCILYAIYFTNYLIDLCKIYSIHSVHTILEMINVCCRSLSRWPWAWIRRKSSGHPSTPSFPSPPLRSAPLNKLSSRVWGGAPAYIELGAF